MFSCFINLLHSYFINYGKPINWFFLILETDVFLQITSNALIEQDLKKSQHSAIVIERLCYKDQKSDNFSNKSQNSNTLAIQVCNENQSVNGLITSICMENDGKKREIKTFAPSPLLSSTRKTQTKIGHYRNTLNDLENLPDIRDGLDEFLWMRAVPPLLPSSHDTVQSNYEPTVNFECIANSNCLTGACSVNINSHTYYDSTKPYFTNRNNYISCFAYDNCMGLKLIIVVGSLLGYLFAN